MQFPSQIDLPAVALVLLESAATALGPDAPTRRYRAAGYAAQDFLACADCDSQLTVCVSGSLPTGPGGNGPGVQTRSKQWFRSWTFTVDLMRAVPVIDSSLVAPSQEALDESAVRHMLDYDLLDAWQRTLGFDNKLNEAMREAGAQQVAPSSQGTVGPSGGVVAIRAQVAVTG